jgi:hypothetical protein
MTLSLSPLLFYCIISFILFILSVFYNTAYGYGGTSAPCWSLVCTTDSTLLPDLVSARYSSVLFGLVPVDNSSAALVILLLRRDQCILGNFRAGNKSSASGHDRLPQLAQAALFYSLFKLDKPSPYFNYIQADIIRRSIT